MPSNIMDNYANAHISNKGVTRKFSRKRVVSFEEQRTLSGLNQNYDFSTSMISQEVSMRNDTVSIAALDIHNL